MRWLIRCVLVCAAVEPAFAQESRTAKVFLDLQPLANKPINEELHDGIYKEDSLVELPQGRNDYGDGVEFQVGPKCVALNGRFAPGRPARVEGLKIGGKLARLQILHACGWGAFGGKANPVGHYQEDGTLIGYYRVNYADKGRDYIPIVYGRDVRDWWGVWDKFKPTTRSTVIWRGSNDHLRGRREAYGVEFPLRLYLTEWRNPNPDNPVASIDMVSTKQVAAPFCVAMTGLRFNAQSDHDKLSKDRENIELQKELTALRKQIEQLERSAAPASGAPQPR